MVLFWITGIRYCLDVSVVSKLVLLRTLMTLGIGRMKTIVNSDIIHVQIVVEELRVRMMEAMVSVVSVLGTIDEI